MDNTFKTWIEQEWKRDMGQAHQLDNPTFDKHSANTEDSDHEPRNSDHESVDNIQALGNHLRALNRLVARASKAKKFFGLERDLDHLVSDFKGKMEELMQKAETRKVQQPQVGDGSQGVPLNQQINPEMAEKLKDEQPPRMEDPTI